jgi:hypothetical protein
MSHEIANPLEFIKAGKAIFTVKNEETKNRFTYKVSKCKDKDIWFVSVLTGSDNDNDYTYIGTVFGETFKLTKNSKLNKDAISVRAFHWVWYNMVKNNYLGKDMPENVKIYHEGRCGRCGRTLTVPESIESGFGPECVKFAA